MEFFATSNGIPVHISDTEKGDITILLLHGYLETLYVWEEFQQLFPKNFRIISIDLPGHGLTGSHPEINSMSFCSDVIKSVLDKCGVTECYLLGHSLGGYIALQFAKQYPGILQGIIMMNSNPYPDEPGTEKSREKEISFISSGRLLTLATLVIPQMFKKENLRSMDEKVQEIIEVAETHDPEGIVASVKGMAAREDNTTFMNELSTPIIAFYGDSDYYFPMDRIEKLIASTPHVNSVIVPNSGHNSYLESPTFVVEKIVEFITTRSC